MTTKQAAARFVWRYGFVFAVAGALSCIAGLWFMASHFRMSPVDIESSIGLVYFMAAVVLGGTSWMAYTGWREGVFREYIHPAPYASTLAPPFLIMLAWMNWPESWGPNGLDNLLFGLCFVAAGVHAMREASPKNGTDV